MRRSIALFFVFRFLALTWVFVPFQVLYLLDRGLGFGDVMLCNVVFCLAAVLFEIPTGVLADRFGRRVALALGGVAMAIGCGFFIVGQSILAFAVANLFGAASMSLISGADAAYLYDRLRSFGREDEYRRFEGFATAVKGAGNVVGFLLGGILFEHAPGWVFGATATASMTAAVIAVLLPESRLDPRVSPGNIARSLATVAKSRVLIGLIAYSALLFVPLRLGLFTDSPHLREVDPRAGAIAFAVLFAVKDLISAACSLLVVPVTRWIGEQRILALLAALTLGSTLWMGLAHGWWCIPLMIVVAGLFGLYSPTVRTALNAAIRSSHDRATVLSIEGMVRRAGFAAISPLIGAAVDVLSLNAALLLSAAATLVSLLTVLTLLRVRAVSATRPTISGPATTPKIPASRAPVPQLQLDL